MALIHIHADQEALSRTAADLFIETAADAISRRGRFAVALAGGSTPRRTYELLAQPDRTARVDWPHVHVFWTDERCVPPDDLRSNERFAIRSLLQSVPVPVEQVHPFRCEPDPDRAAENYQQVLARFFGDAPPTFDLVLLGLGIDGHTASLFPHTPALRETQRWTTLVAPDPDAPKRLTMTVPLINQARRVVFLVSGIDKAPVLKEVLEGPSEPDRLPAQHIHPQDGLTWLIDRSAATLLCSEGENA